MLLEPRKQGMWREMSQESDHGGVLSLSLREFEGTEGRGVREARCSDQKPHFRCHVGSTKGCRLGGYSSGPDEN